MNDEHYKKYVLHSDFEKWLEKTENLRDLSDEIGANWVLVKRFLTWFLAEHGFYVLSEREIEKLQKEAVQDGE